ncbi:MAG: alpha-2-macroglobulin family protein [Verrucomicrobiota bacterium]
MNRPLKILTLSLGASLCFLNGFGQSFLPEAEPAEALTAQRYPQSFSSDAPFTPRSPILLEFNAPVSTNDAAGAISFYDEARERTFPVNVSRPSDALVRELKRQPSSSVGPSEHYLVVTPQAPLPLGGTYHLHIRQGLRSSDGGHRLAESQLTYLSRLNAFEINSVEASAAFNESLRLRIYHNKAKFALDFEDEKLLESVTVSPSVENLSVSTAWQQVVVEGDFEFGRDYTVTVNPGWVARDTTQLTQRFIDTVRFEPRPGYVALPTFAATQHAGGHRGFQVESGNLTGVRTRIKSLEGDRLFQALRDYDDQYEGWGEGQNTLPFATIPGETIHDVFHPATVELNESDTLDLRWDDLAGGAETGAFYLSAEGQSITAEEKRVGAHSIIQLTDIGLAWKQSKNEILLYSFSLDSGSPLPGTSFRLVDENLDTQSETLADARGIARLPHFRLIEDENPERFFLEAQLDQDRYVMRFWGDPDNVGLWNFPIDQRYESVVAGESRTLIFADRNVYKPGETIQVKGISRLIDEGSLLGANANEARLRLFDARNRRLEERTITLSSNGSFDESFTLPSTGLGYHTIELDFNPVAGENRDWRLVHSTSVSVEEYRVNTFEIDIDMPDRLPYEPSFTIPLSAKYFMGKPLSKAKLDWSLFSYPSYPNPRGFEEFIFGDGIDYNAEGTFSTEGTGELSSRGDALIDIEMPPPGTTPSPRTVRITTQVTDANQQTISQSKRFTVDSSDFYLGLRQPEGDHRAGDTLTYALAAVAPDGTAWPEAVEVNLTVEKETWNTVRVLGANGRPVFRNDRLLTTVSDQRIELATTVDEETGLMRAHSAELEFPEAGDFIVTLAAQDAEGRSVITRSQVTIIGAEEASWSWYDVTRIDLIPDRSSYQVGDTAKLLVRSPVFGDALLTVERDGVDYVETIQIQDFETVVEVPIEEGAAPNLFASVFIVRGEEASPHIHSEANYRLGYCQLEVEDPQAALEVTLDSGEKDYYLPGEDVTVVATVTDHAGAPAANAEVTLWAVDEGVLSLTGFETPDPESTFHAPFPLAVWTGQSISSLLSENPNERAFENKGFVIGGGGNATGLDPDRVRKDFKPLAFWEPTLTTNAAGEVSVTFPAPDNLTTFRIMAVVARGNQFGHAEKPVVTNKPLIIEPALPRITHLGDRIDLGAVLHNNTASRQNVSVRVELDVRAVFLDSLSEVLSTSLSSTPDTEDRWLAESELVLDPGETSTVSFPVQITETGEATWRWAVQSKSDSNLRDRTESKLEVAYPLPLLRERHTTRITVGDEVDLLADSSDRVRTGTGEVEVRVANTQLADASDALDYLLGYPYGCVEQTTSRLVPWLTLTQLQDVLPELSREPAEIDGVVSSSVDRLFSMQTSNGGLGYWPGASRPVLWGSAYGGLGIALAQQAGADVAEERANALWDYLAKELRNVGDLTEPVQLADRCLALYTLTLAGRNESAYHQVLYERRNFLGAEARALLALAMIEQGEPIDEQIETLLAPSVTVPVAEVSWYRKPYRVATRLLAQMEYDSSSDRTEDLFAELMELRGGIRGWGSTYSNAWSLIALGRYGTEVSSQLEPQTIEIVMGGERREVTLPASPASEILTFPLQGDVEPTLTAQAISGGGRIHLATELATRPDIAPLAAENNGFALSRTYQRVELDGSLSPLDDLSVGDLVLVQLKLNIPNPSGTYLAIDDPIPAIFEAVNPRFESQATQRVDRTQGPRRLYCNHREMRDDRVVFFADSVSRSGDYLVEYLARVIAPGEVIAPTAKIEAMYEPQRYGLSGTETISARELQLGDREIASR